MELSEAIELIQNDPITRQSNALWADLGSGSGLFSFALAHLLQTGSVIYAVDKNPVNFGAWLQPVGVHLRSLQLDFVAEPLPFHDLDGILLANSLHYVRDKPALIGKLSASMKPGGRFLVVEYDTDKPVPQWVPYPVSFPSLRRLFENAGYSSVQKLGERPSVFGRARMYAALIEF
ncbi:MAG TPA: methyltransferase domain-containing protein [Saprospiraceae bacterium]|nr:methyltransferase domain-containing protein [Saprospiraceae bacterium]